MPATDPRRRFGDAGEAIARAWLERRGYSWIASNWHYRGGELDLVMLDGDVLVFVEVKTRRSIRAGRPDDAVTAAKAKRILATAEQFIAGHPNLQEYIWRCDLIAIFHRPPGAPEIRHYENALVSG